MYQKCILAAAIAAAGLMACGRDTSLKSIAAGDPPQDRGELPPPNPGDGTAPGCETVTIRVLGVAQGDVSAAHLVVGSVSAKLAASGDALALAGVPLGATVDLSTDMQSAALGAFPLAAATGPVTVTLSFSGGHAARGPVAGELDVCTGPIAFRLDPAQVHAVRCQVIVKLDVGRSLLAAGDALSFLPQFAVAF